MKNKRGLSMVVTVVILILLALVAVGLVWSIVKNLINKKIEEMECIDTLNKLSLNNRYTCYNSTSKELRFSVEIGNIEITEFLVGLSNEGGSESIKVVDGTSYTNIREFNGNYNENINVPGKNEGKTYVLDMSGSLENPDSIKIAPILNKKQCEISDELINIDNCMALLS